MSDSPRLADLLARRVGARLPYAAEALRRGEGVRMQRQTLTLLFVDAPPAEVLPPAVQERFHAEVAWLAARHGGAVDEFAEHGTLVLFEHATAAIDMAMDLQQADFESRLRIAVTTTSCLRLRFPHADQWFETVLGVEEDLRERAVGGDGGIRVSPSTYALVRDALQPVDSSPLSLETEPGALDGGPDLDLDLGRTAP